MSTILKALQRLEDEKSANAERSLSEQVVAHRPPPDPERRGLRIAAVAVGGVAIAAAAYFFWPNGEKVDVDVALDAAPAATAPAAADPEEAVAEKPRRNTSARRAPAAPEAKEVEISSVVEVVNLLDAPRADSEAPAAEPEIAEPPPQPRAGAERPAGRRSTSKPKPRVARVAEKPKTAPEKVRQSEPIADPKPPAPQTSGASVAAEPAPALPEPVEVAAVAPKPPPAAAPAPSPAAVREPAHEVVQRAKLPPLSIEKTVWHPDADRRIAVVKLVEADEVLRLKEGDAVGPLVVISIQPDGVLFDHDGVEVRYNVGG